MVLPISSRAMLPCVLICLIIDALCLAFSSFVCPQPISTFLTFLPSLVGISVLSIPAPFSGAAVRAPISSITSSHIPYTFFPPQDLFRSSSPSPIIIRTSMAWFGCPQEGHEGVGILKQRELPPILDGNYPSDIALYSSIRLFVRASFVVMSVILSSIR
jgi:hypothetical protein